MDLASLPSTLYQMSQIWESLPLEQPKTSYQSLLFPDPMRENRATFLLIQFSSTPHSRTPFHEK